MTKALRIDVDPRVLRLARTLESGRKDFSELKEPNKRTLLRSNANLEGLVDPEVLERERLKLQVEEADRLTERAQARIKLALEDL